VRLGRRFAATCLTCGALAALLAARGEATGERGVEDVRRAVAGSKAAARAVERVAPAVVTLRAIGTGSDGHGAGIVVDSSGLVLTALHVVDGATAILVEERDKTQWPGRLLGGDPAYDLALVRIERPPGAKRRFAVARFGDDEALGLGETVLGLSNPFGVGASVSRGVLSARDRRKVVPGIVCPLLQTDAAINPGSSGGALLDLHGEVIGLITAILTRSGGDEGVGFAVPASEIRRALPFLMRGERVRRPWIGLRVSPARRGSPGLTVREVVASGPGERAGIRAGDRLILLAGTPLKRIDDLRKVLEHNGIGDLLRVRVIRGRRDLEVEVQVEAHAVAPNKN